MLRDLRGQISGKCTVSSERRTRDYDWAAVAIGTTSSAARRGPHFGRRVHYDDHASRART